MPVCQMLRRRHDSSAHHGLQNFVSSPSHVRIVVAWPTSWKALLPGRLNALGVVFVHLGHLLAKVQLTLFLSDLDG